MLYGSCKAKLWIAATPHAMPILFMLPAADYDWMYVISPLGAFLG